MKFSIKKYFQVLGSVLGAMLLAFFVLMGFNWTGEDQSVRLNADGTVALTNGGTINVLLMCTDEDGLRTDAMMLACYDTGANTVNLLSIPRDLRMFIGNRYQKINAAHAYETNGQIGGPVAACEAVTRITGVPINYYIDFSFNAVAKVIDDLGPVNFTIPDVYGDGVGMVYDDPVQNLHINLKPGNQNLNGEQVVHLLRYRKDNHGRGYPRGDEDRIAVQQEFLKTLVDQKLNVTVIQKIPAIYSDIMSDLKTNLSVKDVIKYSKYLTDFTSAGIHAETVVADATYDSSNGDVLIPNMAKLQLQVQTLFGVPGQNMWYGDPKNRTPALGAGGYMTTGGYVRTTNMDSLSVYKGNEVTNDELCLIRGIVQTVDSYTDNSGYTSTESDDAPDGAVYSE
ncbi:MAG: LCP family protein [Oscillospiraceae bacterium]|nr:LCP family protein [Oscillospiraceae bacterium]